MRPIAVVKGEGLGSVTGSSRWISDGRGVPSHADDELGLAILLSLVV